MPIRFLSNDLPMATRVTPLVPLGEEPDDAALQQSPWRNAARLSSAADAAEAFLARAGFDRGPWLAVALAIGIAAWFALPGPGWWVATIATGLVVALGALALWRGKEGCSNLVIACVGVGLLVAAGAALIWASSELAGAAPIERPGSLTIAGKVLERIEQPADDRIRLVLATRDQAGPRDQGQGQPAARAGRGCASRGRGRAVESAADATSAADASRRLRFCASGLVRGICRNR
jgi:competence protein ComEC